jgi:hypothetical protein
MEQESKHIHTKHTPVALVLCVAQWSVRDLGLLSYFMGVPLSLSHWQNMTRFDMVIFKALFLKTDNIHADDSYHLNILFQPRLQSLYHPIPLLEPSWW